MVDKCTAFGGLYRWPFLVLPGGFEIMDHKEHSGRDSEVRYENRTGVTRGSVLQPGFGLAGPSSDASSKILAICAFIRSTFGAE